MNTQPHSQKFLRQRKFLIIVPILILPFILLVFWALGGGTGSDSKNGKTHELAGMNFHLPDAHFTKKRPQDKLALYEQASKDSAKLLEAMKNDPYYVKDSTKDIDVKKSALETIFEKSAAKYDQHFPIDNKLNTGLNTKNGTQAKEDDIMQKLTILKTQINQKSENKPGDQSNGLNNSSKPSRATDNPDIAKLEKIMGLTKNNNQADPDITRLDGMLNKIMAIQHPESIEDSIRKMSEKNSREVFTVQLHPGQSRISLLDTGWQSRQTNSFFSLPTAEISPDAKQNAIEAEIQESQTLVSGATVKLRLVNDVFVSGLKIPKDAFIYGTASLNNERLKISINSLRSENNILPVALEVYDMDGMAGIYIPGSISRDVSKQSADQAISTIGLTTLDPSIQAQAASAGIQAAKTLISKKVKLVRVTVKQGYKVLLKDESQK
jgi:conjugative transposon TraM protein